MEKVIEIKPLDNFEIWVLFADHYSAKINVRPFITSGSSLKLLDTDFFQKVRIDEFGGIVWENGFDFCPNYLREFTDKLMF